TTLDRPVPSAALDLGAFGVLGAITDDVLPLVAHPLVLHDRRSSIGKLWPAVVNPLCERCFPHQRAHANAWLFARVCRSFCDAADAYAEFRIRREALVRSLLADLRLLPRPGGQNPLDYAHAMLSTDDQSPDRVHVLGGPPLRASRRTEKLKWCNDAVALSVLSPLPPDRVVVICKLRLGRTLKRPFGQREWFYSLVVRAVPRIVLHLLSTPAGD
ncbi:MAG: hypothetical protein SGPRY_013248, partial [Prymnesium sp.]